jgi:hypothetical protein
MKFSSVREYFLKLHNFLYIIILVPLLAFGYVYLQARPARGADSQLLTFGFVLVYLLDLTVSARIFWRRMKEARMNLQLTSRLQAYAGATMVRFAMIASACLILVAGFLLTGSSLHAALFVFSMILLSLWWPSPSKACKDLRLKEEERDIILRQKDLV